MIKGGIVKEEDLLNRDGYNCCCCSGYLISKEQEELFEKFAKIISKYLDKNAKDINVSTKITIPEVDSNSFYNDLKTSLKQAINNKVRIIKRESG